MFKGLNKMVGNSPVMQFAKKAAKKDHRLLFNSTSPHAVSVGLDQRPGLFSPEGVEDQAVLGE